MKNNKSFSNKKHVLATTSWHNFIKICFAIVLSLSFLQGCSRSSSKIAIISVLEQDRKANDGTTSVAEYVANQNKIDLSDCPNDFKKAYIKHLNAWREMASVEQEVLLLKKMYVSDEAQVEAFVRGINYDYGMLTEVRESLERVKAHESQAKKEIRDTFGIVLDIASDYGVDIEPYSH